MDSETAAPLTLYMLEVRIFHDGFFKSTFN